MTLYSEPTCITNDSSHPVRSVSFRNILRKLTLRTLYNEVPDIAKYSLRQLALPLQRTDPYKAVFRRFTELCCEGISLYTNAVLTAG